MAVYVDASYDPYWTRRYAASGKVSRVGRVMPCLASIAVNVGPGVPLLIQTFAGTASLKKQLVPTLERLESIVGEGELGRLTIVDAESATPQVLSALMGMPERLFVTVWKGNGADPKLFTPTSQWKPYRKRDQLREGKVIMKGEGAPPGGLELRAVEMKRRGSRHPHSTIYLTSATMRQRRIPFTQVRLPVPRPRPGPRTPLINALYGAGSTWAACSTNR